MEDIQNIFVILVIVQIFDNGYLVIYRIHIYTYIHSYTCITIIWLKTRFKRDLFTCNQYTLFNYKKKQLPPIFYRPLGNIFMKNMYFQTHLHTCAERYVHNKDGDAIVYGMYRTLCYYYNFPFQNVFQGTRSTLNVYSLFCLFVFFVIFFLLIFPTETKSCLPFATNILMLCRLQVFKSNSFLDSIIRAFK